MIAKNVGIRRARGEFVLCTNVDILFSDPLFAFLATRPLEPGRSYRSVRRDTTFLADASDISPEAPITAVLAACERHLLRINTRDFSQNVRTGECHVVLPPGATAEILGRPPLFTNACSDFTLLSREDYGKLRGYAELDMFSFHLDSLFLFAAHYAGLEEVVLPGNMVQYHIEHGEGWTPEVHKTKCLDNRIDALRIPRLDTASLLDIVRGMRDGTCPLPPNNPQWGLAGLPLPDIRVTRAHWEHLPA